MYSRGYRPRGRAAYGRGRGDQRSYYMLMSLLVQVFRRINALEKKPPVTIFLLIVNCVNWYAPDVVDILPSVSEACLRPERLYRGESWVFLFNPVRMIFSAFLHGSEYHLYHNMLSLLNKGIQLELRHKPGNFAFMTAFLLFSSNSLYIVCAHLGEVFLGLRPSCAIGFSGVLFGYKCISMMESAHTGASSTFFGVEIPQGVYVSWIELITIQFAYPNASFLGHLTGIISGYVYYKVFLKVGGGGGGRQSRGGGARGRPANPFASFFNSIFSSNKPRFHGHSTASSSGAGGGGARGAPPGRSSADHVRQQRTKKFE